MSTEFEVGHSIAALMSQLSGILKGLPNGITLASLTVLELGILRRHIVAEELLKLLQLQFCCCVT